MSELQTAQSEMEYHISAFTPFDDNGDIGFDKIDDYVKYIASLKVDGISIMGISGEGMSMTIEERKKTAEKFLAATKKHGIKYVNINVSSMCIKDIQELAAHADLHGASSVSVLPNMFHKPTCAGEIIDYLETISHVLNSAKIVYINVPEVTGVYTRAVDIIEFGSKMPKFGGLHDSGVDLTDLSRTIWASKKYPHLSVFCSRNVDIVPTLAVGCTKFIGPSLNFCLPVYRQICNNYKTELGIKQQQELLAALSVCCKYGLNVSMLKACTEKIAGIELGSVRKPMHKCRPEIINAMDAELSAMDFWNKLKISNNN
ncbi:hypothetical protein GJ496_000196 [Pomphorhynchus laevis]|nr:hypothetical protein GJ496_000196 [Pomphorhynchus laevis]